MSNQRGLRAHFSQHGYVHAGWIIFILLMVIVGLATRTPSASSLMNYANFAATITSLFLGVIAIFYSMISNQGFSETSGSLKSSVDDIQVAAKNIADTSATLLTHSDNLIQQVTLVPASVDRMSTELVAKIDAFSVSEPSANATSASTTSPVPIPPNYGAGLAVYALVLSHKKTIDIDTSAIRKDAGAYVGGILFGFLSAVKMFRPCDVKLEVVGASFRISDIGKLKADEYLNRDVTNGGKPILIKSKKAIDKSLGVETADEDSEDAEIEDDVSSEKTSEDSNSG
jgi:hypothetical protein